ncbi:DoxX family protein [Allorhodopirellula solitaria]|uniref:DoxX n=1 Tax=Allorhodopirellula solitaria TaxID=2527987 RepID=A0A5C5X018_9BACT|nr:DoxX family protein [Allorhodopirellula solitaria]TWT55503.1 hypothetical protein CA85_49160 [Allorhodopirellula solitaria]
MNILLWGLQILLALHTAMGAVWKFTNSVDQTMPTLNAIPNPLWIAMGGFELVLALALLTPAFYQPLAFLAPVAAVCIAAEMVLFTVLHLYSGDRTLGPVIYWLVVAGLCLIVAYGRFVLVPGEA